MDNIIDKINDKIHRSSTFQRTLDLLNKDTKKVDPRCFIIMDDCLENKDNWKCFSNNRTKLFYNTQKYPITLLADIEKYELGSACVGLSEIHAGDVVDVSYCPYSQRYLEEYSNNMLKGRVCCIDEESQDAIFYYDTIEEKQVHKNHSNTEKERMWLWIY